MVDIKQRKFTINMKHLFYPGTKAAIANGSLTYWLREQDLMELIPSLSYQKGLQLFPTEHNSYQDFDISSVRLFLYSQKKTNTWFSPSSDISGWDNGYCFQKCFDVMQDTILSCIDFEEEEIQARSKECLQRLIHSNLYDDMYDDKIIGRKYIRLMAEQIVNSIKTTTKTLTRRYPQKLKVNVIFSCEIQSQLDSLFLDSYGISLANFVAKQPYYCDCVFHQSPVLMEDEFIILPEWDLPNFMPPVKVASSVHNEYYLSLLEFARIQAFKFTMLT